MSLDTLDIKDDEGRDLMRWREGVPKKLQPQVMSVVKKMYLLGCEFAAIHQATGVPLDVFNGHKKYLDRARDAQEKNFINGLIAVNVGEKAENITKMSLQIVENALVGVLEKQAERKALIESGEVGELEDVPTDLSMNDLNQLVGMLERLHKVARLERGQATEINETQHVHAMSREQLAKQVKTIQGKAAKYADVFEVIDLEPSES